MKLVGQLSGMVYIIPMLKLFCMHVLCVACMSSQEIQGFVHTNLQSSMFTYFNFELVVAKTQGLFIAKWLCCIAHVKALIKYELVIEIF